MDREQYLLMARLEDEHWWFVARRRLVATVLESLNLPADAEILEAGCGTGGNLALLSRFGKLRAMELDDGARALAERRGVAEIASGRLPDAIPYGDARFDLILLLDVLEHVAPHAESLVALKNRLKPGGHLLITVPAFPFLWSRHDEVNHHQRRYVKKTLRDVVHGAGLSEVYCTYFNSVLFPAVAAVRVLKKTLGKDSDGDLRLPSTPVNKALEGLFAGERHALARRLPMPFGVSLMMLARN